MNTLFNEMWTQITEARDELHNVVEFRMNQETRRDLIRSIESRQVMSSLPGIQVAFGIPVVVDPRLPDGVILPTREFDPGFFGLSPMPPLADQWLERHPVRRSVDESHGMTLEELIPEAIAEWERLRDEVSGE